MVDGDRLPTRLGHSDAALCRTEVAPLNTSLAAFFDSGSQFVRVTRDIENGDHGKTSQLDVAVVLAALHGDTPAESFFGPADDRILSTATKLQNDFAARYPINGTTTDVFGRPMSPAIGRYPEDQYDGDDNNEGNPWFLATAGLAEHAYRVRAAYVSAGTVTVTALNRDYLASALAAGGGSPPTLGETIASTGATAARFAQLTGGLKALGDGYLRRIRRHAADDGSLSEQFKATSGFMTGAVDLTWSYAALLTAISRR